MKDSAPASAAAAPASTASASTAPATTAPARRLLAMEAFWAKEAKEHVSCWIVNNISN